MIQRISLLCVLASLLLILTNAAAAIVDRSVAIVNNDTITLSEVNELGQSFFKKITEDTPPDRLAEALYRARLTVIDKLIEKKLMVQEAEKLHIQVSDQDVDGAVQRILAGNKTTMEQFRKELNSMGMSEKQYREELRDQILSSRLVNYEVRTKVVIPEEKILDYYDTHYVEQGKGGGYYLQQIGCTYGSTLADGSVPTQDDARGKYRKPTRPPKTAITSRPWPANIPTWPTARMAVISACSNSMNSPPTFVRLSSTSNPAT